MAEPDQDDDAKQKSQRVGRRAQKQDLSPEQALEEAQKTIAAQAGTISSLEKTGAKTAELALASGAEASNATLARLTERETAITNGMTSAKNALEAADMAWRQAREAGNLDDEQKANRAMSAAQVDLKSWEFQEQDFKTRKPQLVAEAKALASPPIPVDNSRSENWKADHPKFASDPQYKADATAIHDMAVAQKISPNSDAYFTFLNDRLGRIYGENHGKDAADGGKGGQRRQQVRDRTSDGASPSRESSGGLTYHGESGNLRLSRGADGKDQLDGDIPEDWAKAAEWTGMKPVDYAISQMRILEERRRASSDGSLEAGVYR